MANVEVIKFYKERCILNPLKFKMSNTSCLIILYKHVIAQLPRTSALPTLHNIMYKLKFMIFILYHVDFIAVNFKFKFNNEGLLRCCWFCWIVSVGLIENSRNNDKPWDNEHNFIYSDFCCVVNSWYCSENAKEEEVTNAKGYIHHPISWNAVECWVACERGWEEVWDVKMWQRCFTLKTKDNCCIKCWILY